MENVFTQQGWQCPVCKHIYSPTTMECPYCNHRDVEVKENTDESKRLKRLDG